MPGCGNPPTGFLEFLTWINLRSGLSVRDQPGGLQALLATILRGPVTSAAIWGLICPAARDTYLENEIAGPRQSDAAKPVRIIDDRLQSSGRVVRPRTAP